MNDFRQTEVSYKKSNIFMITITLLKMNKIFDNKNPWKSWFVLKEIN